MMKAWVHFETGAPETLRLEEVPAPVCGPDDVVVTNRAIGLNPVDWKFVEWGHEAWVWPHIPGVDGAGVVSQVGANVTSVRPGQAVAYHNDLLRPGSFAEQTAVPSRALIPLPSDLPFDVAATIPCPALTAWQALEKVPLAPGTRVLLTGASGAVGGAWLQLARRRGWIVHALASKESHARVLGLGAARCHDYRSPNWRESMADELGLRPFFAVFDMVSGAHAKDLADLVEANGHLVCIQDRQEVAPLPAFTTTISLHEVGLNGMHHFGTDRHWGALMEAGRKISEACLIGTFDPQLTEVAAFEDLPAALTRLKSGPNPGNRVVQI